MSHAPTPAPSVLAGLKLALKPHAPFAAMTEHDLDRVVRASQLRYFAPGEVVLAPAAERPASCFVVRQGTVRGERPGVTGDAARTGPATPGLFRFRRPRFATQAAPPCTIWRDAMTAVMATSSRFAAADGRLA